MFSILPWVSCSFTILNPGLAQRQPLSHKYMPYEGQRVICGYNRNRQGVGKKTEREGMEEGKEEERKRRGREEEQEEVRYSVRGREGG